MLSTYVHIHSTNYIPLQYRSVVRMCVDRYVSMCCVPSPCVLVCLCSAYTPSTHISSSSFLAFLFLRATVGCLPSILSSSTLFLWATEKSSSSSLTGRHSLSCVSSASSAGLRPSEVAHCLTWSSFFCTHSTTNKGCLTWCHMMSHDVTLISMHPITYGEWLHTCFSLPSYSTTKRDNTPPYYVWAMAINCIPSRYTLCAVNCAQVKPVTCCKHLLTPCDRHEHTNMQFAHTGNSLTVGSCH